MIEHKTTRKPRTVWRPEWDDEMRRDWAKPTSLREFSRRFGVHPTAVVRHAVRLGLWRQKEASGER